MTHCFTSSHDWCEWRFVEPPSLSSSRSAPPTKPHWSFSLLLMHLFSDSLSQTSITLDQSRSVLSHVKIELQPDQFYFILSSGFFYFPHQCQSFEMKLQSFLLFFGESLCPMARGHRGRGLLVSSPASHPPEGTKPLKCSLSLYISSLPLTLQAAEQVK